MALRARAYITVFVSANAGAIRCSAILRTRHRRAVPAMTCPTRCESKAKQGSRNYADAIRPPISVRAGRDDNRIEQILANLVAQPQEVSHVIILYCGAEFDFYRDDSLICTFDNKVDLLTSFFCTQVEHARLARLREDAHRQRHQRFKELPEQCAVTRARVGCLIPLEQRALVDAEQPRGKCRIGKVMFRRLRETSELVS